MSSPTANRSVPSVTIPTREINGDLVIHLGDVTLVSSKSEPTSWRVVENLERCCCPGFGARGRCRHIDEARIAAQMDDDTEKWEALKSQRCSCGASPWTIRNERGLFCSQCVDAGQPVKGFVR